MNVDKRVIKALANDKKVDILKILNERRKMPSEVAKEVGLAPSTTIEHIKQLESLGLIRRVSTGHKWVYYELTEEGRSIVNPSFSMKITLMLSAGFIMIVGGFAGLFFQASKNLPLVADSASAEAQSKTQEFTSISYDPLFLLIFAVGLLFIIYSVWKMKST